MFGGFIMGEQQCPRCAKREEEVGWKVEYLAEEYECAMMHLDDLGIPRKDEKDNIFSIVGRIDKAKEIFGT
jgi:hypothetical protein